MKFIKKHLGVAALGLLIGISVIANLGVHAQQAVPGSTPVQQAQPLYNCNQTQTATGAANTAVTVTFTPPAGQYFYICSIHIVEVANATVTGAAGPAPIFTTTNLQNQLVWWGDNSSLTTGQQKIVVDDVFPLLLKTSAAGTAFTIVTSAGQSTQNVRINVTGFFAS
jgi:hypothetical protein